MDPKRRQATALYTGSRTTAAQGDSRTSALLTLGVGFVALAAGLWFRSQPPAFGPVLAAGAASVGAHRGCMPGSRLMVQPGDTLWGLAQRCAGPQGDPRAWVEALREANGLTRHSVLEPGRALRVPADPGRRVRRAARAGHEPAGR